MKIRMTKTAAGPEGSFLEGHVYEFEDDSQANAFIEAGAALEYIAPAVGSVTDVAELQARVEEAEVRANVAEAALDAAQEKATTAEGHVDALKTAIAEATDLDELKVAVASVDDAKDEGEPPVDQPAKKGRQPKPKDD